MFTNNFQKLNITHTQLHTRILKNVKVFSNNMINFNMINFSFNKIFLIFFTFFEI